MLRPCLAVAFRFVLPSLVAVACLLFSLDLRAADWPQWRGDAARRAMTTESLPQKLHLQWTWKFPQLTPAWPGEPREQFDGIHEPVVSGRSLFVASSAQDSVTAMDTRTGQIRWRFFANGPVRFAPISSQGRVYFGSDDGRVYCLNAADGQVVWSQRIVPNSRKALGHDRLISCWPITGGPVLSNGVLYVAAGVWQFEGIFLAALDAETGKTKWINDGVGSIYMQQPHGGAVSFSGPAPGGYLTVAGDKLLMPCGRSVPACFDLKTGKLLYFHHAENKRNGGGPYVAAGEKLFFCRGGAFALDSGQLVSRTIQKRTWNTPVLSKQLAYHPAGIFHAQTLSLITRWKVPIQDVHLQAGNCIYSSHGSTIMSLPVAERPANPTQPDQAHRDQQQPPLLAPAWKTSIEGTPVRLIAADKRLFVVTNEGSLLCFAGDPQENPVVHLADLQQSAPWDDGLADKLADWPGREQAKRIDELAPIDGYCLVLGIGTGGLIRTLAQKSGRHIVVVDANGETVKKFRQQLNREGLYGQVVVHQADLDSLNLPPYWVSLLTAESPSAIQQGLLPTEQLNKKASKQLIRRLYPALHPYHGRVIVPLTQQQHDQWTQIIQSEQISGQTSGVTITREGELTVVQRAGGLPKTFDWSHEGGNPGNTAATEDDLVKAPLGVLWYGGRTGAAKYFDRHVRPSSALVVAGRLFFQGPGELTAADAYTGRVLWTAELPVSLRGHRYAATADAVYVQHNKLEVFDAKTGQKRAGLSLAENFSEFCLYDDLLIGCNNQTMAAYDRHTGKLQWRHQHAMPVKGVVAGPAWGDFAGELTEEDPPGAGSTDQTVAQDNHTENTPKATPAVVYYSIGLPASKVAAMQRRGQKDIPVAQLVARELTTGRLLWQQEQDAGCRWVAYSHQAGVVLGGSGGAQLTAYRADSGKQLWRRSQPFPCSVVGQSLVTNSGVFDVITGKPRTRSDLAGNEQTQTICRMYGCNRPVASPHLVTFRSGTAGFFDLQRDGGTGNLGGFRTGCTNSLIPANGLLNAPNFAHGCSCAYTHFTALALVHIPEAEMWTHNNYQIGDGWIRRLGINLAAPGDRKSDDGTLWLDYPVVGGPGPKLSLALSGEQPQTFRQHALRIESGPLPWVTGSGLEGLREFSVGLAPQSRAEAVAEGIPVMAGTDDAEEYTDGKMYLTSSDLEFHQDGDQRQQIVGIRFQRIPLQQGEALKKAWIQFTVDEPTSKPTQVTISAQASDQTEPFAETRKNISDRPLTKATVAWSPKAWPVINQHGPDQRTPDLKDLISEVINRPGWKEGNSLAFIFDGQGHRVARSFEGGRHQAARLILRTARMESEGAPASQPEQEVARYTVRLYFSEPEELAARQRVFSVWIQDNEVISEMDVVSKAGGAHRGIVEEVRAVAVKSDLKIRLVPKKGEPILSGVELIKEEE